MNARIEGTAPANSLEVRARLVEALKLDIVGTEADVRADQAGEDSAVNSLRSFSSIIGRWP